MRRIGAACLLIIVTLGLIGGFVSVASTSVAKDWKGVSARAHIEAMQSVVLAGHCVALTWDIQLLPSVTGHFFLDNVEVPAMGSGQLCTLPKEGVASPGIVLKPDSQAPAEGYTVPLLVIPQDFRLWVIYGLVIGAFLLAIFLLVPAKVVRSVGIRPIFDRLDNGVARIRPLARLALMILCVAAGIYYAVTMNWSWQQVGQIVGGFVTLWGGFFFLCYLALERQVEDKSVRFSLSAIASYTLVTLFFFLAAVARLEWLYYVIQVVIWGYGLYTAIKRKVWRSLTFQNFLRIDWILILLILMSLIIMIPNKKTVTQSPDGKVIYRVIPDQVYNAGLSYELSRHIPPQQATSYAGMPERAYHLFPHLTTMLMARFTNQPDMLTAQVEYGYTVIELLICLGMYGIVRTLTRSTWAGYLAVAFAYLLVLPWFMLYPSSENLLYFMLFPFGVNGVDLVSITTPQMYSSIPVVYGALLGVLLIGFRTRDRQPVHALIIVTALMAAALMRFRLHFAVSVIPITALWFGFWWLQKRRWIYLVGLGVMVLFAAMLYLEMRSSAYLPATSNLVIRYNGLSDHSSGFINSFPFARELRAWVYQTPDSKERFIDGTRNQWVWQFLGLGGFVLLNMIGIPALLTFLGVTLNQVRKRHYLFFCLFILALVITSIVTAGTLWVDYDSYSVGGQLLFHPNWFILPLLPLGIWSVYSLVHRDLRLARVIWIALAVVMLAGFLTARQTVPDSPVLVKNQVNIILSPDEWAMLRYLRDSTPQDAVIFAKDWYTSQFYIFSGTAGRISYASNIGGIVERYMKSIDPAGNREQRIASLLAAVTDDEFCDRLWATPITYLVEYPKIPYPHHPQACVEEAWVSANQVVSIWQVIPKPAQPVATSHLTP